MSKELKKVTNDNLMIESEPLKSWKPFILIQYKEIIDNANQLNISSDHLVKHYCQEIIEYVHGIINLLEMDHEIGTAPLHLYESWFAKIISLNYQIRQSTAQLNKQQLMFIVNISSKLVLLERMINYLFANITDFTARRMKTKTSLRTVKL